MTDVCIYTRISSDNPSATGGAGLGVARQEKDCRVLAKRLGANVARVYTDNDISAYSGKRRPQFEAMLAGVKRGQYDALICWHPDRLYRSMKDLERIIDICEDAQVPIQTVNGGDLDLSHSTGKMMARILGSVSRQESEHKAERIRAAKVQRAEAGRWHSNVRVFGYTMDGKIVPAEAKLIRKVAKDILTGVTMTACLRDWHRRDIRTAKGNKWSTMAFKRMLINPRYAGLMEYHGKVIGKGNWQAIINPEDHAGLVAILTHPNRGHTASWERKYVGSFRYICGKCGAMMQQYVNQHAHRYRCTNRSHLARMQAPLDAYVEGTALEFMRDDGRVATLLAAEDRQRNGMDAGEMRSRREALQAKKDELAGLLADGVLDVAAVRREAAKLTDKIVALDAGLADLARRSPLAEILSEGVEHLDKRWANTSPDIRGKILDELFSVIVLPTGKGHGGGGFDPNYVRIVWNAGTRP